MHVCVRRDPPCLSERVGDNSDDEAEHSKLAQLTATVRPQHSPPDTQARYAPASYGSVSVGEPEERGGISAASGTFCVPTSNSEAVNPVLPSKHRRMSEPILLSCHASESSNGPDQGEHTQMTCEQAEIQPTCQDVVVSSNPFNDTLPTELQLAVLKALVSIHEEEHQRAERGEGHDQLWTVRVASKTRWVGRDKGLRELVKLGRVSKAWQSLVFDGQLWDVLDIASSPPHLSSALLLRLVAHAGSFVRSLSLRGWTHLDPVMLRALVHSLAILPTESDHMLCPVQSTESTRAPSFPSTNLTHLSLRTCTSLTTPSLHHVLLRSPSLCSVDLRGLGAVTNTTCGVMSAFCPGIESLDLGRCPNMDADGLLYLLGDGAARWRSWTSDEGSVPIRSRAVGAGQSDSPTPRLRVLRASGLRRLTEEVLTVLGKAAPHLEVLDLSGARDLTDKAVEAFVTWDEAWDLPSYTSCQCKVELSAREMGRDPATEFGPCVKRMTRLRHLNLSSCFLLTDLACTHLAHCVSQLEFLELAGIGQGLKDEGLVRLLATTPLLRRLDLEDASDITDAVLEVLTVSPPGNVVRRGARVQPLPPPPGSNLEHLILSYALSVTNDALLGLIRACRRLTVLECDNTRISGMVVREFVKLVGQRRLRGAEVVAVDCRAITESLVKELASSGRTRARKGYRHYEARLLGYVDSRDVEDLGAAGVLGGMDVDDCDDTRVAIKSFWSWQAVDAIRQAREKRRKLALNSRRNTHAGVLGEDCRRSGLNFDDDEELLSGNSGAGPSSRPRWLTQWARLPGSGSSTPTGSSFANEDDRGCIII
ncbi:hypothetical protein JB92DRAFT_3093191 [Gautieria morchelliformis]|nr:hypothetical protein JB92DRAFT_3093191 [Gautieria morchelliformis]